MLLRTHSAAQEKPDLRAALERRRRNRFRVRRRRAPSGSLSERVGALEAPYALPEASSKEEGEIGRERWRAYTPRRHRSSSECAEEGMAAREVVTALRFSTK